MRSDEINILNYIDDPVLIADNEDDLQRLISEIKWPKST